MPDSDAEATDQPHYAALVAIVGISGSSPMSMGVTRRALVEV